MVNLKHPVPGGSIDTWGNDLNENDANLGAAADAAKQSADEAKAASETAVAAANSVTTIAAAANVAANTATTAANTASAKASTVETALAAHAAAGDPHPQYLTTARGDARYPRLAGVGSGDSPSEAVLLGQASSSGVAFSLSFSPYGLRADGSTYYNAAGVDAADRAWPIVQQDGSVKLVRLGAGGSVGDVVPPVLSSFAATADTGSATVTVTSNEVAAAVVEYGTTTSYGQTAATTGSGTALSVPLTGLISSTVYHYRWRVTDQAGNLTVSPDQTFSTLSVTTGTVLTIPNYTNATASEWQYSMASADTLTANQYIEATVTGLVGANANAGFIFHSNSTPDTGFMAILSGTQFKFETLLPSATIVENVAWSGAGSGSGTMRVELVGTRVMIYWNGALVVSRDLASGVAGFASLKRAGVGIWNATASQVSLTNIKVGDSTMTSPPGDFPTSSGGGGGTGTVGTYPLVVSSDSRHIQYSDGTPLLLTADTAWGMAARLSVADAKRYVDIKASQGFNCLMFAADPFGRTNSGARGVPFTGGNVTTPNASYWSGMDEIIDYMATKNMIAVFLPLWMADNGGWANGTVPSNSDFATYCTWLGNRYKNKGNIIYAFGGDEQYDEVASTIAAGAAALEAVDPNRLKTYHPRWDNYNELGSNTTWHDFNSSQRNNNAAPYTYDEARTGYGKTPTKPHFSMEPPYYPDTAYLAGDTSRLRNRQNAWGQILGGSLGVVYGGPATGTWGIAGPGGTDWNNTGHITGNDVGMVRSILTQFHWEKLVPNWTSTIVTSSRGTGINYVLCGRASDGTVIAAYLPNGGSVTVALAQLAGAGTAYWFDPSTGAVSSQQSVANTGTQTFTVPGNNAAGNTDWVLMLATAAGLTGTISGGSGSGGSGGSGGSTGTVGAKAQALFGPPRSGLPWHSGAFTGNGYTAAAANGMGTYRGAPLDFVTSYPSYDNWTDMGGGGSAWSVEQFNGFGGRISYGLPMLPKNRAGQWGDVNSGSYDYAFTYLANLFKNNNRADSFIRVGLECNGNWFPHSVTWSTADQFIAAFRRIVGLFRGVSSSFKFGYCWNAATLPQGMPSGTSPSAQLEKFYPGDAYVDAIECDHYDFYQLVAQNDSQWAFAKAPVPGAGLDHIAAFARSHGKGVWLGEWGMHSVQGPGDNPFFMQKMWEWCVANSDILVGELYFSEPDSYIANAIYNPVQLPNGAAKWRNKWGRPDLYPTGA